MWKLPQVKSVDVIMLACCRHHLLAPLTMCLWKEKRKQSFEMVNYDSPFVLFAAVHVCMQCHLQVIQWLNI